MLSTIRKSKQEAFTIIEVLIVLAIAGLILLVVFLAVPALQRNARNTQRSTDVGNVLSAFSEFVGNNNGKLPAAGDVSGTGNDLTIGAAGTNQVPVKLGYFDASNVALVDWAAGMTNDTTTDQLRIVGKATCATTPIGDPATGSSRSIVILYTLEKASKQCRAS